jgi:hypothetical protein
MPVHTEQRGSGYVVVDDKGKVHGKHRTKSSAHKHATAMNIQMGYAPGVKPREKK